MDDTIRPYGPGKFNTILDAYVHSVSMDGCCAECGSVSETGRWYGMIAGSLSLSHADKRDGAYFQLNSAERDALRKCAGVILTECDQGFVDVEYYETETELHTAWDEIEIADTEQRDEIEAEGW